MAKLAADAALDGVLTSPHETARVRAACGRRFTVISSGMGRSRGWEASEYPFGAAEAVRAGADYLVVGNPIWRSNEPLRAVREITDEMERGLRGHSDTCPALRFPVPLGSGSPAARTFPS
jgi:orotidine-5'-phosphate decarboxylase